MDTFERKEAKYLLSPLQYIQFRALADRHLAQAEHHETDICSAYYDTPDNTLAERTLREARFKENLRVRSYNGPVSESGPGTPVFIEVKRKFKDTTSKRRISCTAAAARAFLSGMDYEQAIGRWPLAGADAQTAGCSPRSTQIAGEISWMAAHYPDLAPKMEVASHRLSFAGAADPALRVTFDDDVRWRTADGAWRSLFAHGERILEVKCQQAMPLWLVEALSACGAKPMSASKYGLAYQACSAGRRSAMQTTARARVGGRTPQDTGRAAKSEPGSGVSGGNHARARSHAASALSLQPRRNSLVASIHALIGRALGPKPAHAAHR